MVPLYRLNLVLFSGYSARRDYVPARNAEREGEDATQRESAAGATAASAVAGARNPTLYI